MQAAIARGIGGAPAASRSTTSLGRKFLLSAAVAVISAAALLFVFRSAGPFLSWDGMDYAQVARQIVRGRGMTSKFMVFDVLSDENMNPETWPDLIRAPAAVYMESWVFRMAGSSDLAATVLPSLFAMATAVAIFWLAEPLFGAGVAFVSSLVFAVSPAGLMYAGAGLTETTAMFLLTLAVALLLRAPSTGSAALIGLSMSLCALTRPVAYLWAAILAIALAWRLRREGRAWAAPVAALGIAFLLPLLAVSHALRWQGGRAALAINLAWRTNASIGEAMRSPLAFVLHHPGALAKKMVIELARPVAYGFRFGGVLLFSALSLFGLAMRQEDENNKLARGVVVAIVAGNALALAVLNEGDAFAGPLRYFDVFVPLLVPWGVAALWVLAERIHRPVFYGLLAVMLAGCPVYLAHNPGLKPNPQTVQMYRDLGATVPAGDVIAAGALVTAPAIAWYGDRYVIWPVDPSQGITNLRRGGMPVRWYFSAEGGSVPQLFQMVRRWPQGYQLWRVVEPDGIQTK